MKKKLLSLVILSELVIAGGQQGTGSEPEDTTTESSDYKLVCIKNDQKISGVNFSQDTYGVYCMIVPKQAKN
ncbi:MAG: hypothetical protein JKX98_05830 [Alcanivoracaceae bacterium]|nr:hypothetical protein [Alcanivoracaceae bacterium]